MDSNHRSLSRRGRFLRADEFRAWQSAGSATSRFVADSLLEGTGFEPSVPRLMDGDLGRQVPALIAVFELAGTAMTLQRGTKMIRPDRHPEFPRQIVEEFGGGGVLPMSPYGLQTGVADRKAGHLLTNSVSVLPSRPWRRS